MRRQLATACVLLLLAGCGSSPSGPTPIQPSRIAVQGTITNTVTGAAVGTFSSEVTALPALVTVSAAGYHTRQARITAAQPTVDLIPESFDLAFYRQLARNGHEAPGVLEPLRLLTASPSIYLQRTGLSDATVAALEQAARAVVPALTGGRLTVAAWETGEQAKPPQAGWIVIDRIEEPSGCGRSLVGAAAGHIWINFGNDRCDPGFLSTLRHELGHALGFYHVDVAGSLMRIPRPIADDQPTQQERAAATVAYARATGNRDVDADSLTSAVLSPVVID